MDLHHIQHTSLRSSSASWGLGRKHSLCFHCNGSSDIRDTAWSTHSEQHWMLKERKPRMFWNPKPFVTGMCYKRSAFLAPFNRTILWTPQTLLGFFGWSKDSDEIQSTLPWLRMRLSTCVSPSHLTGFSQRQPVRCLQLKLCGPCDISMCREQQIPFLLNIRLTLPVLKSLTEGNRYSFWRNLALAPLLSQVGLTFRALREQTWGSSVLLDQTALRSTNIRTKFTTEKSVLTTSRHLRFLNAAPSLYTHFSAAVTSWSPKQAENTF